MGMSKGRIGAVYQGWATSLKPCTAERGIVSSCSVVALTGTGTSRVRVEFEECSRCDVYLYKYDSHLLSCPLLRPPPRPWARHPGGGGPLQSHFSHDRAPGRGAILAIALASVPTRAGPGLRSHGSGPVGHDPTSFSPSTPGRACS